MKKKAPNRSTSKKSPAKKSTAKPVSKRSKPKTQSAPPDQPSSYIRHSAQPSGSLQPGDMPLSYNKTQLALLVRDPQALYSYWDFSAETWNWIQDLRKKDKSLRAVLRIHNQDAKSYEDRDVDLEAKSWYVHVGSTDVTVEAELGLVDPDGKFYLIAKSNRLRIPRSGPSPRIDKKWPVENFDEIYRLSGGGKTGTGSEFFSWHR